MPSLETSFFDRLGPAQSAGLWFVRRRGRCRRLSGRWRAFKRMLRDGPPERRETVLAWYVYMVRCADGTLYTGTALDVTRRIALHNEGKGAKYTRGRRPVCEIYRECCADRSAALRREAAVKRLSRQQKLQLAASSGQGRGGA